jgi:hypothetical protein
MDAVLHYTSDHASVNAQSEHPYSAPQSLLKIPVGFPLWLGIFTRDCVIWPQLPLLFHVYCFPSDLICPIWLLWTPLNSSATPVCPGTLNSLGLPGQ